MYNIIIHEYANALWKLNNWSEKDFLEYVTPQNLQILAKIRGLSLVQVQQILGKPTLNFFAVAIEHFFYNPTALKEHIPALYKEISSKLNQDPTNPANRVNPANPANPVNPVNPVNAAHPANPANPTNPANPVNPVNPINPINPVNPANPVNPVILALAGPRSIFGVSDDVEIEGDLIHREPVEDICLYLFVFPN